MFGCERGFEYPEFWLNEGVKAINVKHWAWYPEYCRSVTGKKKAVAKTQRDYDPNEDFGQVKLSAKEAAALAATIPQEVGGESQELRVGVEFAPPAKLVS